MTKQYRELTLEDREQLVEAGILNGCGPSSWRGRAPQWLFRACCMEHDWNYTVGGQEADRRWADWGFYTAMLKDTIRLSIYQQPWARIVAWLFYQAVRWKGKPQFTYREMPKNKYHFTVVDLIKEQTGK